MRAINNPRSRKLTRRWRILKYRMLMIQINRKSRKNGSGERLVKARNLVRDRVKFKRLRIKGLASRLKIHGFSPIKLKIMKAI